MLVSSRDLWKLYLYLLGLSWVNDFQYIIRQFHPLASNRNIQLILYVVSNETETCRLVPNRTEKTLEIKCLVEASITTSGRSAARQLHECN